MFCLPSLLTSRKKRRMQRTEHHEDTSVNLPHSTSVSSLDSLESLPKLDSYERICWYIEPFILRNLILRKILVLDILAYLLTN